MNYENKDETIMIRKMILKRHSHMSLRILRKNQKKKLLKIGDSDRE